MNFNIKEMIRGKIRSVCFVCESIHNILSCWGTTGDPKTNKKNHHNFETTGKSYTGIIPTID